MLYFDETDVGETGGLVFHAKDVYIICQLSILQYSNTELNVQYLRCSRTHFVRFCGFSSAKYTRSPENRLVLSRESTTKWRSPAVADFIPKELEISCAAHSGLNITCAYARHLYLCRDCLSVPLLRLRLIPDSVPSFNT
jgi:hypothetical protein